MPTLPPYLTALSDKVCSDIYRRRLVPGDRYMTTEEAARMLGVRKAVANEVMRHLAQRALLVRRQRSGTFIGPAAGLAARSLVRTAHVVLPAADPLAPHWSADAFIRGIRGALPDVNVQFSFLPPADAVAYVQALIAAARSSGQLVGMVPISCPAEIYRHLAESRVPTVVYGSLHGEEPALASVDVDNRQAGRLLAQHLIHRGCRRLALLAGGLGRPGENHFWDGVSEVLAGAGLPHNALVLRLVGSDPLALPAAAREVLSMPDHPTGIITRGPVQADVVRSTASLLGLTVPGDLEIVFDYEGQSTAEVDRRLYPRAEPQMSFTQIAATIGEILKRLSQGEPVEPRRVVVPMEFHDRDRT